MISTAHAHACSLGILSASGTSFWQATLRFADSYTPAGLRQCEVEKMDITFGGCLPNWLIANQSTSTSPYGFDAMLCPGLTFWRPNSTQLILADVSHSLRVAARAFAQFPASKAEVVHLLTSLMPHIYASLLINQSLRLLLLLPLLLMQSAQ